MPSKALFEEQIAPRRPDAALHNTEAQFRLLLEKLPAAAYTCNPEGLITYFNARAQHLWGRAPKLNDPADRFCGSFKLYSTQGTPIPHDQCWMAQALHKNQEFTGHEIVIEQESGRRATVLAHAHPICDETGRLLGAVNVLVDITNRKQDEENLKALNETLEQRVAIRTAELNMRADQLWKLASELANAELKERKKLAASLHDELAQSLALCNLKVSMLQEQPPAERSDTTLSEIKECIANAIQYTRSLMYDLRPPDLFEVGLSAGLRRLADIMKQQHGLEVIIHTQGAADLDEQTRAFLFRSVKELLTNVIKYAGTNKATVDIHKSAQEVRIAVEDRGVGLDVRKLTWSPSETGGFGLFHIRERLAFMGGHMEIDNPADRGTRVRLIVPLLAPKKLTGS